MFGFIFSWLQSFYIYTLTAGGQVGGGCSHLLMGLSVLAERLPRVFLFREPPMVQAVKGARK